MRTRLRRRSRRGFASPESLNVPILFGVLLVLSVKVASFSTGTGAASSTVDVTLGFQPKAFICWWSGRTETTDTVGRADSHIGWGFGKSNTARGCTGWSRDDNNAAETGGQFIRDDAIVYRITTANVADGSLDIDATANWPSDGIRFIVDTQFGASVRVHIWAFGGTDITDTAVGSFTPPIIVCNNGSVTPGFQPNVVFFAVNNGTTINTGSATEANPCFGAAISSTKQAVNALMFDPGSATGDGGQHHRAH